MRLRRAFWTASLAVALVLPLTACGDDPVDETDAAMIDAGMGDAGGDTPDAGRDGGSDDAGGDDDDAGEGDAGEGDAGEGDAGQADAGGDAAIPVEGPVVTSAAPASVARGSSLELTGLRLGAATAVTIGGTAQTVDANTATSITIDAVDVATPTGMQPIVVTTADGSSAPIDVIVLEPLAVVSAAAPAATTVVVTFSRDVDATSVTAASFTIAGLTVSAASVTAATVTLTTSSQTPAASYTVDVAGTVTDTFGNALTGADMAAFVGFEPAVPVITTTAPMHVVPGDSELTLTGMNLAGATVTIGGAAQVVTSSTATQIVIGTVSASTPLGTQPIVATLGGIGSAPVDIEVVDAFRIVSATATSATSVDVVFNRNVHAPVAMPARFTITGGLTVSGVSVAGATATLTTSAQTPGTTYTVGADAMLLDTFGIPVTADAAAFSGFVPTETVIETFATVVAANHPAGAGVSGTWYDATDMAFADATSSTLSGAPALRIGDGGFGNGVYAIYESAIPVDGTYRISVPVHVIENATTVNGVRAYQVGVAVGSAAVHRPAGTPSAVAALTTSASYTGLTATGDDTAVGPQTLVTVEFTAQAGDDLLIAFGTDVASGMWNMSSGSWGTAATAAYVLVGPITLVRSP